ncbi:MAG: efflux RND transporter periplasmic adaptor subunit, partial [Thermoanaerobaculia bacterium]
VGELEAQANRARSLAEQQLISRAELETLEAQLAAARASARQEEARIDQARAAAAEQRTALTRTVVRAPVSGRIGERNAEVGMIASPSTVLFVVGDLGELVVEVPLTQEMLQHVRQGTPVVISSPALGGQPIHASLSRISPFLSAGSFSTIAEIDVANADGRLRPGMFVTVDLLYGSTTASTLVPTSALWEDPATGIMQVYVVGGASADPNAPVSVEARPVDVVGEGSGVAGVTAVREGEWVVVAGQHLLARDKAAAARVRRSAWEKVVGLQQLQREDLLAGFLAKQQRYARTEGAEPPTAEAYLGTTEK